MSATDHAMTSAISVPELFATGIGRCSSHTAVIMPPFNP